MHRTRPFAYFFFLFLLGTSALVFPIGQGEAASLRCRDLFGQGPRIRQLAVLSRSGDPVFARHYQAQEGRPTFLLLNGLIYDIGRWQKVVDELTQEGFGVVQTSYVAQPESLRLLEGREPNFLRDGLELSEMAKDLDSVMTELEVDQAVVVGLSFGSTVAAQFSKDFPKRVRELVLMAPLVVPLETYHPVGSVLRHWMSGLRMMQIWNPFAGVMADQVYQQVYGAYFNMTLDRSVDGVSPEVYRRSIFEMVRATREFDLNSYRDVLKDVHVMVAGLEERPMLADQLRFWDGIKASQRRSRAAFVGAHHAMADVSPIVTADWLKAIGLRKPEMQNGNSFTVEATE